MPRRIKTPQSHQQTHSLQLEFYRHKRGYRFYALLNPIKRQKKKPSKNVTPESNYIFIYMFFFLLCPSRSFPTSFFKAVISVNGRKTKRKGKNKS